MKSTNIKPKMELLTGLEADIITALSDIQKLDASERSAPLSELLKSTEQQLQEAHRQYGPNVADEGTDDEALEALRELCTITHRINLLCDQIGIMLKSDNTEVHALDAASESSSADPSQADGEAADLSQAVAEVDGVDGVEGNVAAAEMETIETAAVEAGETSNAVENGVLIAGDDAKSEHSVATASTASEPDDQEETPKPVNVTKDDKASEETDEEKQAKIEEEKQVLADVEYTKALSLITLPKVRELYRIDRLSKVNERVDALVKHIEALKAKGKVDTAQLTTILNDTYSLLSQRKIEKDGVLVPAMTPEQYREIANKMQGHSVTWMKVVSTAMLAVGIAVAAALLAFTGVGLVVAGAVAGTAAALSVAGFWGSRQHGMSKAMSQVGSAMELSKVLPEEAAELPVASCCA